MGAAAFSICCPISYLLSNPNSLTLPSRSISITSLFSEPNPISVSVTLLATIRLRFFSLSFWRAWDNVFSVSAANPTFTRSASLILLRISSFFWSVIDQFSRSFFLILFFELAFLLVYYLIFYKYIVAETLAY